MGEYDSLRINLVMLFYRVSQLTSRLIVVTYKQLLNSVMPRSSFSGVFDSSLGNCSGM